MSDRDVQLFETLAGDLLVELGYATRDQPASQSVTKAADSAHAWFAEHFITHSK